jgi:hypothetical protein
MLYAGAAMLEGIVVWLLVSGVSGWIVALVGAVGFGVLLAADAAAERGAPGRTP